MIFRWEELKAELEAEKAALVTALAAAETYGQAQHAELEATREHSRFQDRLIQRLAKQARDAEDQVANLQAARPVDSREARNARLGFRPDMDRQ